MGAYSGKVLLSPVGGWASFDRKVLQIVNRSGESTLEFRLQVSKCSTPPLDTTHFLPSNNSPKTTNNVNQQETMAKSAAKALATRNAARLRQTHLTTLALHTLFLLLSLTLRRSLSLKRYILFSLPALLIETYLHILAQPSHAADGTIRSGGSDLADKGLTEFMWDVVYWTWINLVIVVVVGNWGWWLYAAVPAYAVYCVVGAARGVRGLLSGGGGAGADGEGGMGGASSKRQAKMEKRGGQRVAYR
jgi:hypothetical protein